AEVGDAGGGGGGAGIRGEQALRQPPRLFETAHLVVGEAQRRMEPPVVAVRGGQTLEEGRAELLAVAPAAQADRAAGLVDEERIARELRHVLVDQVEAARRVASDESVER